MLTSGRNLKQLLLMGILAFAVGCPRKVTVWITNDSTPLQFAVGQSIGTPRVGQFTMFLVERCDAPRAEQVAWQVSNRNPDVQAPSEVVYGTTPPGFTVDHAPAILGDGCYQAWAGGGVPTRFVIEGRRIVAGHR